ncbi:MAG: DUF4261 domain-containing protein [Pirellula sp.]|jgi:hypothetical protein|nr:DUF4261 domain-containing protein [Pirellula sp.]
MTTEKRPTVEITLRIPGDWRSPNEVIERLPNGYRIVDDHLILPDQTKIEVFPIPPDNQFSDIFRTSLRHPANPEELEIVDRYTMNVGLSGPGGSLDSAQTMMNAAAAIMQAGGAGVFIDNSCLSHGAEEWLHMTEEGSSDAISFGFVGIVQGKREVWTMGMHIPGFPDIVMTRADADANDRAIIEMIRYICASDRSVGDGHIIADENGPRFQIQHEFPDQSSAPEPMRNPFGRLRMVSFKDIAEQN